VLSPYQLPGVEAKARPTTVPQCHSFETRSATEPPRRSGVLRPIQSCVKARLPIRNITLLSGKAIEEAIAASAAQIGLAAAPIWSA
jgi:hypothetical protein